MPIVCRLIHRTSILNAWVHCILCEYIQYILNSELSYDTASLHCLTALTP